MVWWSAKNASSTKIVERTGPRQRQIDDLQAGRALHLVVKVGKIERHGVGGAEDCPIECFHLSGRDLEEGIAVTVAVHEPLGGEINAGENQKTYSDKGDRC